MAAEIVQGLFGVSPQSMKAQLDAQNQAQQMQLASLSPEQQRFMMMGQGGRAAGQALGGLFGAQDPMMMANNQSNDLVGQVLSGLTPEQQQDPMAVHTAIYNAAMQAGDMELANRSYGQIQQAKTTALSNDKIAASTALDIKKASADAKNTKLPIEKLYDAYEEAKNTNPAKAKVLLQALDKEVRNDPKYSGKAQELVDANLVYGSDEFNAKMLEYIQSDITGKSKGSGNVNLGGISIDSGKISEEAGKLVGKDAAAIESQYAALDDFAAAKKMLQAGIFAGPYGPSEMKIAKFSRQNLEKVSNTEKFKAYVAQNVIKRLKDIGGNDTQEERDYLEAMVGGDITFEYDAILAMINSGEAKIQKMIDRTKYQVNSAGKGQPIPLDRLGPTKRFNRQTGKMEVID
jgi:hypothetical protein